MQMASSMSDDLSTDVVPALLMLCHHGMSSWKSGTIFWEAKERQEGKILVGNEK